MEEVRGSIPLSSTPLTRGNAASGAVAPEVVTHTLRSSCRDAGLVAQTQRRHTVGVVSANYLDIPSAASYLSVSVKTIRRLIGGGELAHYRVGRVIRIAVADLEEYMAAQRVAPVNVADLVA
jgi:excisionase family DNA binding protein